MRNIRKISIVMVMLFATITGCDDKVLEVENANQPDFAKVYASGSDLENLASGLYNTVYQGMHSASSVEPMLATAADNVSCSWGNFAMRDMSWEPRNFAWNNGPSYSYRNQTKYLFDRMYAAINTSSNVIKALNSGVNIGPDGAGNDRARAMCKFIQGLAYGNLALVFDKAFIVDEDESVEGVVESAVDYKTVTTAAIGYFDEAIALSDNTFTIPATWLGTEADLSNADFKKLISTSAARVLAYTPRNQTDLNAADWSAIRTYADAGITSDFNVVNDAYTRWYHEAGDYLTYNGWGVTDMYVVNLMDPTQPQHWTDAPSFPHPPASTSPIDERMNTDFSYLNSNWFQAARGYYHYSNYRYSRTDDFYINATGPKAEILKAENDMLRAEARIYGGAPDLAGAAAIINASTRVTRGNMAPVGAVQADLIDAIHHERHVEMYITGMGLQFFEMRKRDLLQAGTPLHLPLPAETLQTFRATAPYYTFGTVANADGVNTSNGGWR